MCDATRPSASRRLPEKALCAYGSCTSTSLSNEVIDERDRRHAGASGEPEERDEIAEHLPARLLGQGKCSGDIEIV